MKPIISSTLRRAALCLPALGLMLAPLAAHATQRVEQADVQQGQRGVRFEEQGVGGRSGIIEEFNFGPTGMDVIKQRTVQPGEGGTRLLSGRVVEMKGSTLYVEREGVVVPLDTSALRITQQPKAGQDIIATYSVEKTRNVALSLAGEVAQAR